MKYYIVFVMMFLTACGDNKLDTSVLSDDVAILIANEFYKDPTNNPSCIKVETFPITVLDNGLGRMSAEHASLMDGLAMLADAGVLISEGSVAKKYSLTQAGEKLFQKTDSGYSACMADIKVKKILSFTPPAVDANGVTVSHISALVKLSLSEAYASSISKDLLEIERQQAESTKPMNVELTAMLTSNGWKIR